MSKRLVTDPQEIYELLLADAHLTEAVSKDKKGVYIMGGDGSKRYITQLEIFVSKIFVILLNDGKYLRLQKYIQDRYDK